MPDEHRDTIELDEPVSDATPALDAGSTDSSAPIGIGLEPGMGAVLVRAILASIVAASCVLEPGLTLLVLPFVPAIVAIGVLRSPASRVRLYVASAVASAVGCGVAALVYDPSWVPAAALAGVAAVAALGWVHARSAAPDAGLVEAWPEPRPGTGFTFAMFGWVLFCAAGAAVAAVSIGAADLSDAAQSVVREAYSVYDEGCRSGGAFEDREEFCARVDEQRGQVLELTSDHMRALVAAFAALFAVGSAATAHLFVSWRARQLGVPSRPSWPVRDLEVHWSCAYVLAGAIAVLIAVDQLGLATDGWLWATGVGVATLGGSLIIAQGFGLAAWLFSRGRLPRWYRALLVVIAMFVLPIALTVLFCLGMLDFTFHPRRRNSATLTRRGSGS